MRGALVFVLLSVAAATWLAWPQLGSEATQPFLAPELVQVEHPGGVGLVRNLATGGGRIRAKAKLDVVFRWLVDPVELDLRGPSGGLTLRFGRGDLAQAELLLEAEGVQLTVRGEGAPVVQRSPMAAEPERVTFAYVDGAYAVRVDGEPVGQPVPGPAPSGAARIAMTKGSSFRALGCRTRRGDDRTIEGMDLSGGVPRTIWAALAALLGSLSLVSWGRVVIAGRPGGGWAWVLCTVVVSWLLWGVVTTLGEHNGVRLGSAPQPCEQALLRQAGPIDLRPGAGFSTDPRRDGDFVLTAEVVLHDVAALDVIVRAAKPNTDRGVIVTLSTDPELPSSVSRNLGTFLETHEGDERLARLEPGRRYALRVECEDADTRAYVDGIELATVRDYDLRAGHVAFYALSGRATAESILVQPSGQPEALPGALRWWQLAAAAGLLVGLLLLGGLGGRRAAGVLWAWPLAVATSAVAPEGALVVACLLAGTLLLLTPRSGSRLGAWIVGAAVIAVTAWGLTERAPPISASILNRLNLQDVRGEPVAPRYMWARHPLCRRFNHFAHRQEFRRGPIEPDKRPGVARIVTIGSSSTFGYGVKPEAAFSALLERALASHGVEVEVFNGGVSGSTAERMRHVLDGALLPLAPDVVVIDLSFNDHIQGGTYDERAHFEAMATEGLGRWGQLKAWFAKRRADRSWGQFFNLHKNGKPIPDELRARHSLEPAERFADSLREMALACRAAGAAVMFVQEPTNPEGISPIEPFHEAMGRVGAELGVPVVDPQPALDRAPEGTFLDAVHPNPLGHRIIARLLAERLVREQLVGP